jgi:hypothetical protein
MTLTAANPGGWSLNEVLTSAQMTHLQNQLLNAIDGVGGGTYTLGAALIFAGSDVRFDADVEFRATCEATFLSGARAVFDSGSEVQFAAGSIVDINTDMDLDGSSTFSMHGELDVLTGAVLDIETGGLANVNSGGRFDVNNGGDFNVEAGGTFDLTGTMTVGATGNVNVGSGGNVTLQSGADLIAQSGGTILLQSGAALTAQNGAVVTVEDSEDIVINAATEGFRTMLVATGAAFGWEHHISTELTWEQNDVSAAWGIAFPLAIRPGDTLIDLFVGINPENGHGALPAIMPLIRIVRAALDGSLSTLAERVDTSGSTGVYEPDHYIVLSNASIDTGAMPILATLDPIYLIVQGEAGANAITGLEVTSITGNITARSYRTDLGIYS